MKTPSKLIRLTAILWAGMFYSGGELAAQAPAEQDFPRSLTLDEAISYAIEHNVQVKNQRLEIAISDAQVKEILAQGYPQINANLNYTHNPTVQLQYLPDFISPTTYRVLEFEELVEQNPDRQFGVFGAAFGVPHSGNASVDVSQLIFNGSFFVGLQASKTVKELTQKNVEKAEIDVAESVSLAYFGALVAQERLSLLKNNTARLDTLLNETEIMYQNGFAERLDVQRIKVNRNNVRSQYQNVERAYVINLNMLKFLVGLPIENKLSLTESLADFAFLNQLSNQFTYSDRIEYQQLQINRELALLDVKNNRIQYYPTLNAFFRYGYNAGQQNFSGLFEESPDIEDDKGNIQEVNTWNNFSSVGLNVNIPIFDGFLKANRIRRANLVVEQTENLIRNTENQIDMEVQQAQINLENSLQTLEIQRENMELAEEVTRVTKIKYQEGVGSNLEVIEAENSYVTAETQYYEALYNALVARTSYQKATGTLR
jgi:outer membrane protein TolC